ncbi:MAG: hypothetical protein EXR87_07240 [Gammaproteobacteria bacterium]|nr:hypothetical protein [Gammaproteobacteria bacterium]
MSEPPRLHALQYARRLAVVYGHEIDAQTTYPTGVAFSGRLRLAGLDGNCDAVAADIAALARPLLADPARIPRAAACLAVGCFADEMLELTADPGYRSLLTTLADRFVPDADVRVEDVFFAGTLLGRAFAVTGDRQYRRRLGEFLEQVDTQRANGLFWHCHASPYFWGRGNAFAALGLAEALTYLDDGAVREKCLAMYRRHVEALGELQHASGLWHQLIDDPGTYLEQSASSMIGLAIARGWRRGWLPAEPWREVVERAWRGVAGGIGDDGALTRVCVGTGPLPTRVAYVDRPFTNGVDARGGAMALWFAVEMARLQPAFVAELDAGAGGSGPRRQIEPGHSGVAATNR